MAVDFKVDHSRTSQYAFFTKDFIIKPELNGRFEKPDLEGLIESIVKNGQLVPCTVRMDGGRPVLLDGHCRWQAIVEINTRKLVPGKMKVNCVYFKGTEREGFIAGIETNRERKSTTPIDDAHNIARLQRYNLGISEIADIYHEDSAWVNGRLALLTLSDESRVAVRSGKVKPNAVKALAKMSEEQQSEALKEATSEKPVTKAALKPALVPKPALRTVVKAIAEGGVPPFVVSDDLALNEFCQKLLDFVAMHKKKYRSRD
jgi:ParB-like chromosome segregation protein Spo0J